jgi:hypothetical protein
MVGHKRLFGIESLGMAVDFKMNKLVNDHVINHLRRHDDKSHEN